MANRRARDKYVVVLSVPIAVLVALIVGPTYLNPLPIWLKVVIVVAGCGVIAAIAVYSRRRSARTP